MTGEESGCYAFEYLFRDPSSSVRRALLWALVSRDSSPTTGAPVRMDLLVHSPLNPKSSNQPATLLLNEEAPFGKC